MSTSDAGESELRVVGGERAAPEHSAAPTTAARAQQDEAFEHLQWNNHHGDKTPTGLDSHLSIFTQEGRHKVLIIDPDRLRQEVEADSEAQIQKPAGPRFTSSFFLTLSNNLSLGKIEAKLKKKSEFSPHRLIEPQTVKTEDGTGQVDRQTSPHDTSIETASAYPESESIPFQTKKEDIIAVVCNELETTRDLGINQSFSNGDCGVHRIPCGSRRNSSETVALQGDITDLKKLEKHKELDKLSNPTVTMLSSTVVTVLAPHWSGRLRRSKRHEGTSTSEAPANPQDVTNRALNHAEQYFQETQNQHHVERLLTDRSQTEVRVPLLGSRSNTVGWSSKSGPASLDYECKRKMIQTISLDVNSGRLGNKKIDAGSLSPIDTISPPSPLSLYPNEQKRTPQTVCQGGVSALSSKPTTSSMLLSLRRMSSNTRSSNAASALTEGKPFPLSSLPSDRDENLSTAQLSQTFLNNNAQENSKSLLSPSSMSYRTTETRLGLSPLSSNERERKISEKHFFSSSPISKDIEDTLVTQHPQAMGRTQSTLACSKHSFLSRGSSERQHTNANLFPDNPISSPIHSPYEHSALVKTHSFPARTTLTTKSWWKQVTQEATSPLTTNDTTNNKDKQNTPIVQPCDDYSYTPCPTDNKRFSSQPPNNRDNNNTTESVCKGNMKTQGGTQNVKQRNTEDSPDHGSDGLAQHYDSNLNNREPQELHSLPSTLSCSKISRTASQPTLSHRKDLSKHDTSNHSFTENVPPPLLNLKSSNTPTESRSTFNNSHCSSRSNSIPTFPHTMESERFTKQPLSLTTSMTVNSQALTSKNNSALPPSLNTKTSSSFNSHPILFQTNMHTSSHVGSSFQRPKFTNTATPLGFERSYASLPKPLCHKTGSSLIPTISGFSKTKCSAVSTAATSSSTTGSDSAAPPVPSLCFRTTPVTSAITSSSTTVTISSLLTPPATPVITSHSYSETSRASEGSKFSSSPERDPKKLWVEGKRVRRVTWEDSVDLQHSEPITVEKPDQSQVPTNPLSPSRSPRSIRAPSIFNFLRSDSSAKSMSPLCSPSPKISSIHVGNGGKFRSLSSESADLKFREQERTKQAIKPTGTMIFDHERQALTTPRKERTQSVESATVQCRSSAPLSLPPDFSSDYKLRYSSPPYSSLMSSRSTQNDTKTRMLRSPLFQQASQPVYNLQPSVNTDAIAVKALPTSKSTVYPTSPPQPLALLFQNKTASQDSSKCEVSQTDQINNNHRKKSSHGHQNGQILLVDNRVHISSQSLQGNSAHNSSSTCVTETLVYSIKSKVDAATLPSVNTTPKPLQHTANTTASVEANLSQQLYIVKSKEEAGKPHSHSDQSSSGSSSTESQLWDERSSNRKTKASVLGKSRFFSVESPNAQSPKKSRFALKKSVSTPNPSLSRSDSERTHKTNNKVDQVLNRLRQTFSNKRSDDDPSFPWKWKRASQTPSVSGSSDVSSVSDSTVESTKTLEEQEQGRGVVLKDRGTEGTSRWTQNKYTIIPVSADRRPVAEDQFSVWPDESTQETDKDEQNSCTDLESDYKPQVHLSVHSPRVHQSEFYKDAGIDYKPTNQFLFSRDPSPGRSSNPSGGYPAQSRKTTSSPRSPFSPFSSLSPLSPSPFSSPDVTDDSVFYSPKLQRRKESSSPCEPGEGISLGVSRRSRASTGPPSADPGQDKDGLASTYADLKYGIEPGKSFSVSSVLSSRPSGPGRISTGPRFMSVGDLSESALTCGGASKNADQWSFTSDWTTGHDCRPTIKCKESYFPSDPGKMRSRSLPRSLTLANWSSGVSISQPETTSTPACRWSPNLNTCPFAWDAEGPPTPPPTPPLSPVSRRMSKPSSVSSPTFPSSPGSPQPVDSQPSRGHLPSRGYVSSLSTFEESSDSSSDTTTDDEYYLEIGEGEEKETEL